MQQLPCFDPIKNSLLPSPAELKKLKPATTHQLFFVQQSRSIIQKILDGEDPRILLIVGPCSIHDTIAAKEFATKLHALSCEVAENFYIVLRTHFEKPRTSYGWKGLLDDPFLNETHRHDEGLLQCRQLLLDLAKSRLPTSTEFLAPSTASYLADLISWGCIGARTCESQVHRQLGASLPMPVGFKNNTSGSVESAVNAVIASTRPHHYIGLNESGQLASVETEGNPYAHVVLRGGESGANYSPKAIHKALKLLETVGLPKRLIVDCNHGNSNRNHLEQCKVFSSLIHQIVDGNQAIKGIMLESHLYDGNQPHNGDPSQLKYGVSITDPCLGWEMTRDLIHWGSNQLKRPTPKEYCLKRKSALEVTCDPSYS